VSHLSETRPGGKICDPIPDLGEKYATRFPTLPVRVDFKYWPHLAEIEKI
jgi:hypothetical protein